MIIGLTGKKQAGKDTVADYLTEQYDFAKLSFAALLKHSAAAIFDIDPGAWEFYKNDPEVKITLYEGEADVIIAELTAREFLQRYGTEAHREIFGGTFWVDALWEGVDKRISNIVIPDCRFQEEADSITSRGGVIWRVTRPSAADGDQHASEVGLQFVDHEIVNNENFEQLYDAVDHAVGIIG